MSYASGAQPGWGAGADLFGSGNSSAVVDQAVAIPAAAPAPAEVGAGAAEVETFRRECEARHWLANGYRSPSAVDALMTRIIRARGQAAADSVRDEMRRQWRLQRGGAS